MKRRGGYDIALAGRPSAAVEVLPEVDTLYLPWESRRFSFSVLAVEDGQAVHPGQVLARDPANHSVPLLSPRAGTVHLERMDGHIVLDNVEHAPEEPYHPDEDAVHATRGLGSVGMKRYKLLALGAWQFLEDAHTGVLPDPFGTPRAVIISTVHLEPFLARGDVQIAKRFKFFMRGLEQVQSLLEYQPIYLVMPDIQSGLAALVREGLRGYAWVKVVPIPMRYGREHFGVVARQLGLEHDRKEPVWALSTAGVLAVDRALTLSRPATVRIVSLGGPGVQTGTHLKAIPGYPLKTLLDGRVSADPARVIGGGVLTGTTVGPDQAGLDAECAGVTVLPEQTEREFLGFLRPGSDRPSYSRCFVSALRGRRPGPKSLTTGLRGERRPCIACTLCEEVCPARIMPHLIHKALYQDLLEEAERLRVDLCVRCGLCSYVCPSKIELRGQFVRAQETIQSEAPPEGDEE